MAVLRSKARASHAPSPAAAFDAPEAALPPPDPSNPMLVAILADVAASGSHTRPWGELRRKLFPGQTGWSALRLWCAENSVTCTLNYGSSSRTAEVQFIGLRVAAAQ